MDNNTIAILEDDKKTIEKSTPYSLEITETDNHNSEILFMKLKIGDKEFTLKPCEIDDRTLLEIKDTNAMYTNHEKPKSVDELLTNISHKHKNTRNHNNQEPNEKDDTFLKW